MNGALGVTCGIGSETDLLHHARFAASGTRRNVKRQSELLQNHLFFGGRAGSLFHQKERA